jgi:hypothetical protein
MIHAELRSFESPDVPDYDIEAFVPDDPGLVGVLVTALIGPVGEPGEETFDLFVCTPRWLEANPYREGYRWGLHLLILNEWDLPTLRRALVKLAGRAHGATWDEVATWLGRYAHWEFEGYRPSDRSSRQGDAPLRSDSGSSGGLR